LEQKEEFRSRPQASIIKKSDIQKHLWMHEELNIALDSLYEKYPIIFQLKKCIAEFREIFYRKNMSLLYAFVDNYKECAIPALKSFALGLERDIEAIENAVSSKKSNGFVEGNNNRVKVIKRVMYGRCGLKLLTAKIMLGRQENG
jgi:transposase